MQRFWTTALPCHDASCHIIHVHPSHLTQPNHSQPSTFHLACRTAKKAPSASGMQNALYSLVSATSARPPPPSNPLQASTSGLHTHLDGVANASTVQDDGVILGERHLLGTAQAADLDLLHLVAQLLAHNLTTRQGGNVLQVGLAVVAKAGGLDGSHLQAGAQLVDDQGG